MTWILASDWFLLFPTFSVEELSFFIAQCTVQVPTLSYQMKNVLITTWILSADIFVSWFEESAVTLSIESCRTAKTDIFWTISQEIKVSSYRQNDNG